MPNFSAIACRSLIPGPRALALTVVTLTWMLVSAKAQFPCADPYWRTFDANITAYPGANGPVYASTMWDPDGPGPEGPRLVIGGSFTIAGDAVGDRVAALDLATGHWSSFGTGTSKGGTGPIVLALATLPNGDLIAGGNFDTFGGVPANSLARWNGTGWSDFGLGLGAPVWPTVHAIAAWPSGDVIAGGLFTKAGGTPANYVARWSASQSKWSALGSGMDDAVNALAILPSGDAIAGGSFTTAGGAAVNFIARWNDAQAKWSAFGSGLNGGVLALDTLPDGDVIAGGGFTTASGTPANRVARWDAATGVWSSLGSGLNGNVLGLDALANGDVIVGGIFTAAGGTSANFIARWDAATGVWAGYGAGIGSAGWDVRTVTRLPDGDVIAGGSFVTAGGAPANGVARWSDAVGDWSSLGSGINGESVRAILELPEGDLAISGGFTTIGGTPANHVARWSASTGAWTALGSGTNASVRALARLANGDLVAGGDFTQAGGSPASRIALWDGAAWSDLDGGMTGGSPPTVMALTARPDGNLVAGGRFASAGGAPASHIARWNGDSWKPLGSGVQGGFNASIRALATLPDGSLVAGGNFLTAGGIPANHIARWDDVSAKWSTLGIGVGPLSYTTVEALQVLADGTLVAGGFFEAAGGMTANGIASWNAASGEWSTLGLGVGGSLSATVYSLARLVNGDVIAGGRFSTAGNSPASSVALWDQVGAQWVPLGPGVESDSFVFALSASPRGGLVVGGSFATAGEAFTNFLARYNCSQNPPCYPDCDDSDELDIDDFICFQTYFAIGDDRGDCDGDGAYTVEDFVCFQSAYAAGC